MDTRQFRTEAFLSLFFVVVVVVVLLLFEGGKKNTSKYLGREFNHILFLTTDFAQTSKLAEIATLTRWSVMQMSEVNSENGSCTDT